jgi:hypothetical protein
VRERESSLRIEALRGSSPHRDTIETIGSKRETARALDDANPDRTDDADPTDDRGG